MRFFVSTAALLLGFLNNAVAHDGDAQATYLGNEGVMVARGEAKILFDAFYSQSYGRYALVPDEIGDALLLGEPPYDGIDAIFVSHVHGDHFSAAPAIQYLRANSDVRLYGSQQVYEAFLDAGVTADDQLMKRVIAVDLLAGDAQETFEFDGLLIDVVSIPHSGGERTAHIQNLAWRVALDDATTVMHLGDAGPVIENFELHKAYFNARKTQAAFPPYWFFGDENGEMILNTFINADQTIGIHVPADAAGNGDEWRARQGGDLFTDPGETRNLNDR